MCVCVSFIARRYGDVEDTPAAPELPDWCFEDDDNTGVDEDGNKIDHPVAGNSSNGADAVRSMRNKSNTVCAQLKICLLSA